MFHDGDEFMTAKKRTEDRSDESIVFSRVAESAVLSGFGKMAETVPMTVQVVLKAGMDAQCFSFLHN